MRKTIIFTLALALASSAARSGEADFVTNVKLCGIASLTATKPSDDGMKYLLEECPDEHKHMGGLCSMMLDAWQTRADVQKKVCVDKLIADMIKELQ